MSKKLKVLLAGLITGVTIFSIGCSSVPENDNKQVQEAQASERQNKINELRARLMEECDEVNNSNNHPYTATFRIDTVNDEVRFVILAPNEDCKFYTKSDMEVLHSDIYQVVKNEMKYEGSLYTDFAVFDPFTEIYNVYNSFTYATNGDSVLLHQDYNYTRHEFLKYYNN